MGNEVRQDSLLRQEDILAIENVLYEPVKKELVARQFLNVNTNFPPYAQEVGYDWYDVTGSAKILASGGSAKDIPFVGEKGGRESKKVYDIATGIRYTKAERLAMQAKATLGKGPVVNLDTTRVTTARRFVSEKENSIVFVGDKNHNIKGINNHPGIQIEFVAEGATGVDAAAKRLWDNKTPLEILEDLRIGRMKAKKKKLFWANVLLIASEAYHALLKPYSEHSDKTILEWLRSQRDFKFDKILEVEELDAEYNGIAGDVNCFCIMDNRPEIIELAVIEDLTLGDPVYDIIGTSEQAVTERTAGIFLRHPSSVYIGKGI